MKSFFYGRLFREKVLLTGLLALAAIVWLLQVGRAARRTWAELRAASATLAMQQQSINSRADVEAAAARAIEHLDPARTFSSPRLLGELSTIADNIGVRNNSSSEIVGTDRTSLFAINSVQFSIRNADWDSLKRFYLELSRRSPYIGIEQFALTSNPANPTLLNATFRVSSVEMVR
jgi:hypothetical protein